MNMIKNHWIIIISCILISPLISIDTAALINDQESIVDTYADIPVWFVGDSWTYRLRYEEQLDQRTHINLRIDDLHMKITEELKDAYHGILTGNITGNMNTETFPLDFHEASFEGNFLCDKSTLGFSQWIINIQTNKKVGPITVPLVVKITIKSNPAFQYFNFPISIGKNWIVPSSNIEIIMISIVNRNSEILMYQRSFESKSVQLKCTSEEMISVEAGDFMVYNISDNFGFHNSFYSDKIKNFVKLQTINPLRNRIIELELLTSSVDHTEGPNRPDAPTGPNSGEIGESYTYCAKFADPNYESLFYLFDWDDGSDGGWLGPFIPDDEICMDHIWRANGTYRVRVKVKDELDLESPWSNAITVVIGDLGDITPPIVRIVKPAPFNLYLNDAKIGSFPFIIVVGFINVVVEAEDAESGMDRVEFFVNGIQKGIDDSYPYTYYFDEPPGRYTITVWGYDKAGNSDSDSITVLNLY
jgi:hypothetical protein